MTVRGGGGGDDSIKGGDGDDTITGGAGVDWLDGQNGSDTADYSTSPQGVNVTLGTGWLSDSNFQSYKVYLCHPIHH